MRLVHLTDPHLSTLDDQKLTTLRGKRWSGYLSWRKNRRKHYLPSVLEKLVEAVRLENADQILLTGDLIQIGLDSEIEQARLWLNSLGSASQVMLVPGNHDVYGKGSADSVFRAWAEYLFQDSQSSGKGRSAEEFPVVRKFGKISLIGVSTACVTPVFMATGTSGGEQLERLSELLRQAKADKQMVVLLIHHPPLPGMTNWRKAMTDAAALEAVLKPHPPTMIFYGHLHHNRETQWGDTRIYCTAAASSVSDASYRVIDIQEQGDKLAVQMHLKSIDVETTGELGFITIDQQTFQVSKKYAG